MESNHYSRANCGLITICDKHSELKVDYLRLTSCYCKFLRPQVGLYFSSIDYESVQRAVKGKTGLHFGADLQIGSPFYVQPGLSITPLKMEIKNVGDISTILRNPQRRVSLRMFF